MWRRRMDPYDDRSEEHTSELQSPDHLVCRLLLEKKKHNNRGRISTNKKTNIKLRNCSSTRNKTRGGLIMVSNFRTLNGSFNTSIFFFFFNDTATTEIYTLSLHDALPISSAASSKPPLDLYGLVEQLYPLN